MLCFTLFFLMAHEICSAGEYKGYKLMATNIPIGTTQRHEWHPWVEYNSADDEFMVIWNTSGKIREDCVPGDDYECSYSFHDVIGQRVSPKGNLLGGQITISPVEGPNENVSWKSMARHAYNPFMNEYMVAFSRNRLPNNPGRTNLIEIVRMDHNGQNIWALGPLMDPTPYNASHPDIAFNSVDETWLVVYNDKIWRGQGLASDFDNVGYMLKENGNHLMGPFPIGLTVGSKFAPYLDYNPTNNTYLIAWEEWLYGPAGQPWFFRPSECYGALLRGDGVTIDNITIIDDFDTEDEGYQIAPCVIYNPDMNEFLILEGDSKPSLIGIPGNQGGIIGRIILADGTPKGPEFVAFDTTGRQGSVKGVYVPQEKRYFIVFEDGRDYIPPDPPPMYGGVSDIYAIWLKPDGKPVGKEIPIFVGEGHQTMPSVAYSPHSDSILIAWRDENAPGDFTPIPGGAEMAPEAKADVKGAILCR